MDETVIDEYRKLFDSRISVGATEKLPGWEKLHAKTVSWSCDMEGHAGTCVERLFVSWQTKRQKQLYKVSTPCSDDHHFKKEELETVGEMSNVCSQIVLKCLYLARLGRRFFFWSVNRLARAATKWTRTCESFLRTWMGEVPNRVCMFVHRKQGLLLSENVDDIKMTGKEQNLAPTWKKKMKNVDLDEPTSFLDHVYFGCTQRECKPNESVLDQHREVFESRISATATEKLPGWEKPHAKTVTRWWTGFNSALWSRISKRPASFLWKSGVGLWRRSPS